MPVRKCSFHQRFSVIKKSVETRWFFESPPLSCEALFGQPVAAVERTDWYAFPCHKHNGLKFREGRLETKLLLDDFGRRNWGGASGEVGSWSKWAAEYSGAAPADTVLESTGWIAVHKQRSWQALNVAENFTWQATPIASGCEVEWSVVTAGAQSWWTIGFEAVGVPGELLGNLDNAVRHVLGSVAADSPFIAANSMAYPTWLWKIKTDGGMLPELA